VTRGEELSDEALALAARGGSEAAFRTLVERFERPVYALILRMVHRAELAEDLAQETFVKAWKALGRFDPERKFSSWLFKIAHNSALDALRRRGEEPLSLDAPAGPPGDPDADPRELPADPAAENPLRVALGREAGRVLEEALRELRPAYREILLLRFGEELAYEEIAEVTGLPLGTVKVHLFRARSELAKRMRALGLDPLSGGGAAAGARNTGPGTA
jgi:RNA polymerase sigma-70 factor (ECF subfamily)